ncbi:MAG TPA: ROK family protein, partial [Gemmatimonadales bacterium]|nr:ROK family protein [Gemmatimonadales bacterium]
MTVIALDLGGTKLASARVPPDGEVAERRETLLQGRSSRAVGRLVVEAIRSQLDAAAAQRVAVRGVGICVPGIYRAGTGTVWAPNISGWDDYPLLAEAQAAATPSVPVAIDSDRACAILGETWRGAAQGARDAIFIAVGTGIGAGILVDGRVVRGHGDIAGAVGWLALDRPYRDAYAGMGCFEYHASGTGIAQRAEREPRAVFEAYD